MAPHPAQSRPVDPDVHVISVCSGYGGLDVGLGGAIRGARTICYVEREVTAAGVLVARMEEGRLDQAPVWSDLTTFDARRFRGLVDLLVAGFPCFVAGTCVLTRDTGYVPIESVRVGDYVLTHRGRWRRVTDTMSRANAPLVRVDAHGVPGCVTTPEHPFFQRRKGRRWRRETRTGYDRTWEQPQWTDAAELGPSTFVGRVLPPVGYDRRSTDFWWLVGRYLADGWRATSPGRKGRRKGRVIICCSHAEADELAHGIRSAGFTASRVDERTGIKFHITRKWFYDFLEPFGHRAEGKRVPGWVLGLSRRRARALLNGYMSGDGSRRGTERRAITVSKALALGMALVAQRALGVVAGVVPHVPAPTTVIEGRTVNQRPYWTLHISAGNREAFVDGAYGWSPVRSVRSTGHGTVYNISVDEDESYVADGAIVHNCQGASVAGKRLGTADGRWLWPQVARVIRDCGTPLVFLENVPGLLSVNDGQAFEEVVRDLASMGFDAQWGCYRAEQAGAPHRRDRWFCLGYTSRTLLARLVPLVDVAYTDGDAVRVESERDQRSRRRVRAAEREQTVAREHGAGADGVDDGGLDAQRGGPRHHVWPPRPDDLDGWRAYIAAGGPEPAVIPSSRPQSAFRRGPHGLAAGLDLGPTEPADDDVEIFDLGRPDQLRIAGNGVVVQQAALAFVDLRRRALGG